MHIIVCSTVPRTSCTWPAAIDDGNWQFMDEVSVPDLHFGTRIRYECDTNYRTLSGEQSIVVTCLSSGFWSADTPKCLPIG